MSDKNRSFNERAKAAENKAIGSENAQLNEGANAKNSAENKDANKKRRIGFSHIYIAIVTCLIYLPLVLVIIYSFNESKISSIWGGFSLKWYVELFKDEQMFLALINSIVLALCSGFAAAIIGTLGAIGFSKVKTITKAPIEYLTMLPIMIPEIILAMVFLVFFSLLGLPFGMTTLIIAHTTFCIPYIYMLVKARLVGMDKSLTDAAKDLGASSVRTFFDITLPLLMPAILSGFLLSFAMSFDDVIISLFVTGVNVNTLPIKVYTQLRTGVTPEINALCTLMLFVTILLVVLSNIIGKSKSVK